MIKFLNEIDKIINKYKILNKFLIDKIENKINKLIEKYRKKNSLFNLITCINHNNSVDLMINIEYAESKYIFDILNSVCNSKYLLNSL